jgi:hypothetical protein
MVEFMNNAQMTYFQDEDVLYLAISEGIEPIVSNCIPMSPPNSMTKMS